MTHPMLKSRTLAVLASLLLAAGGPLLAQGGPPPPAADQSGAPPMGRPGPPSPQQQLARLNQALTLTDAQQAAILPILAKRSAALQTLRNNGNSTSTRQADGQQMRVIFDSSNAEIRALLTEPQQAIFDKMQPPPPPGGGQHVPGQTSPSQTSPDGTSQPSGQPPTNSQPPN